MIATRHKIANASISLIPHFDGNALPMSNFLLWFFLRGCTEINRELERVPHAIKATIIKRLTAHFKVPLHALFCRDAVLLAPRLELFRRGVFYVN